MSTKELSEDDVVKQATKKDKEIVKRSKHIVITKPYGKWKKGARPTLTTGFAEQLVKDGFAEYEGIISRTINKFK